MNFCIDFIIIQDLENDSLAEITIFKHNNKLHGKKLYSASTKCIPSCTLLKFKHGMVRNVFKYEEQFFIA